MKKLIFKGALLPASALMTFCLGFEVGGFQFSLLKMAGEYSLSGTVMGLLPAAQNAAVALAPLLMGRLSDRMDKKRLMLMGMACLVFGYALAARASTALLMGLCVCLAGWGQGLSEFVNSALIADAYPKRAGAYMSIVQCMFSLGAVASPLLAAYCMENLGATWQLPFLLAAGGMAISLAWIAFADCTPAQPPVEATQETEAAAASPMFSPLMLLLMASMFLYVCAENGAGYFFDPLFSIEYAAARYSAYAISAFWLATSLSRLLFGLLRLSPQRAVLVCFIGLSLCLLPPALSRSAGWALAACMGAGFLCGPIWPLLVMEATRTHPGRSGQASAVMVCVSGVGATAAPAIMGVLGGLLDYRRAYLLLFAISCLTAALWALYLRKLNKTVYSVAKQ